MGELVIRDAEVRDAKGIATVHVKTWQCAYRGKIPDDYLDGLEIGQRSEKWKMMLEKPAQGGHYLVATIDDKVVGWCTGGKSRDNDATEVTGELYGIYVDPEFIGQGVGSGLLKMMLERFKNDGYEKVTLWVLRSNDRSRGWYEKKGWRLEGLTKDDHREGFVLHEIRYEKLL